MVRSLLADRVMTAYRKLGVLALAALTACATSPRATQRTPVIVTKGGAPDSIALQIAAETAIRDSVAAWRVRLTSGDSAGTLMRVGPLAPRMTAFAANFDAPESARYDPELDLFFVSNLNGGPKAKDWNGYISTVAGDGTVKARKLITGSTKGVTLHAPKGMYIVGDTLWVTDIDVVRAFDKRTGAPLVTVGFGDWKPEFLNDITAGPDGALYVTDMGRRYDASGQLLPPGPSRIFRIFKGAVSVALETERLAQPNGITWDRTRGRFIVAPSGSDTLLAWRPGSSSLEPLGVGPGQYDGVEVLSDGRILVTSWAQSAVLLLEGNQLAKLIGDLTSPADIGLDPRRGILAVPLLRENRVNLYQLGTQ
jgi:sugar lactone lactonase YvrE